ncbi:hypothetical protein RU639_011315 [Aspergillus parasiticus]
MYPPPYISTEHSSRHIVSKGKHSHPVLRFCLGVPIAESLRRRHLSFQIANGCNPPDTSSGDWVGFHLACLGEPQDFAPPKIRRSPSWRLLALKASEQKQVLENVVKNQRKA